MKKIVWIALLVLTMGSVWGCQEKETSIAGEEGTHATTEAAVASEKTDEPDSTKLPKKSEEVSAPKGESAAAGSRPTPNSTAPDNAEVVSPKTTQGYYGKWKVKQYYASYITAISGDEMEALIGAECEYGADYFISGETRLNLPQYSESTETKQEFDEESRDEISFQLLGITTDTIRQISIENSYDFGSMFFVKDENTIIIIYGGVFFEAVRR